MFYVNIEFFEKKTYMISIVTIAATILNVVLNYVCIRRFGYMAAAYTTAFCNFLIVLLHYLFTMKMNNKEICDSRLIMSFMGGGVFLCVLCIISYDHLIMRIVLGLITLASGLLLLKKSAKAISAL